MLLWSPPVNANHVLRSTLRRWSGLEQLYDSPENRKSVSAYIRELEQGTSIEVQGYPWSSSLWRDSFQFDLPANMADGTSSRVAGEKPVKWVRFGKDTGCLAMPYLRYEEFKDLTPLYSEDFDWAVEALELPIERAQ